ncbi:MAG TPA: YciI family protein [Candidatus Dormibacteraeota bacterium]
MKYMLMFTATKDGQRQWESLPEEKRSAEYARIGEWFGRNGPKIVDGYELQSDQAATTVRFDSGKPVVTDGPFLEAKETIAGYAIVDVADLDEALVLAKTWPTGGTVEVRPVIERQGPPARG